MAQAHALITRPLQGLLLAAGRGTRFGADKLLHPLADGTTLALTAARNLQDALPAVLAVVHGHAPELAARLAQAGVRVTVCPRTGEGMGTSLSWGVAQSREAGGWLVALADMPWIQPATIRAIAAAVTGPHVIAAPVYQGKRGHPVAFGRDYREQLLELNGDQGARSLLAAHAGNLVLLPCDDAGVLRDVDYPWQLAEFEGMPARE